MGTVPDDQFDPESSSTLRHDAIWILAALVTASLFLGILSSVGEILVTPISVVTAVPAGAVLGAGIAVAAYRGGYPRTALANEYRQAIAAGLVALAVQVGLYFAPGWTLLGAIAALAAALLTRVGLYARSRR